MTIYTYMTEMQELCFRIAQACKAMNKKGTQDVYEACELGFGEKAKALTREKAESAITPDQLSMYVCTQNFCKEQEKAAATYIEAQLFAGNASENYIDKAFTDKGFLQAVSAAAKEQEKEEAKD